MACLVIIVFDFSVFVSLTQAIYFLKPDADALYWGCVKTHELPQL